MYWQVRGLEIRSREQFGCAQHPLLLTNDAAEERQGQVEPDEATMNACIQTRCITDPCYSRHSPVAGLLQLPGTDHQRVGQLQAAPP